MLTRHTLLLLATVWLGLPAATASSQLPAAQESTTPSAQIGSDKWRQDLKTLVAQLESRHPDLYHRRAKPSFSAALEALALAAGTRSDQEMSLGVVELVASLGDAHTTVAVNYGALGFHRVPIAPYLFDDGVFIRDADTTLANAVIGARVVRIGTMAIDSVLARLSVFIAYENEAGRRNALPAQLIVAELLQAVGASARVDSVELHLVQRDGSTRTMMVATMPWSQPVQWGLSRLVNAADVPLHRRNTNRAYWFEYLERDSTIYIAYNRAANDVSDPIDAFAERVEQTIRERGARRVVVDFRLNSGGNSGVFRAVEQRLIRLKRARPSLELIGLVGRRTFSSGMWNALGFRTNAGAQLYGEPTGGKPNHFGEVRQFSLPNSGLVINHSTRTWRLLRDADPESVMPDVVVPVLASDYFALRDAVMERVLRTSR